MPHVVSRGTLLILAALALGCSAVAAPPDPVELTVLLADDWAAAPAVLEAVERFERAHAGVRVRIDAAPFGRIPDLVRDGVELGSPPDLAHHHAFAAAGAGLAEQVDDLWAEAGISPSLFLPGAVDGVTWDGRRYGLPLDTNALVLLVDREQLAAAELTGDDLRDISGFLPAARAVTAAGTVDHAITVTGSSWAAYGWIVAHGGRLLDGPPDAAPRFTFTEPATVAALELLAGLVAEDLAPPPFSADLAVEALDSFAAGASAMHVSGSWDLPRTRRGLGAGLDPEAVEVLPLPQADPSRPRTVLGGSSLFVPVGAANRELAFALAQELTSDPTALRLVVEEGRLPARTALLRAEPLAERDDLAAFVAELPTAELMPLIAYPDVAAAFREALEDVLRLRRPADEAMQELQRFAEQRGTDAP